jgi:hypothetical protein
VQASVPAQRPLPKQHLEQAQLSLAQALQPELAERGLERLRWALPWYRLHWEYCREQCCRKMTWALG